MITLYLKTHNKTGLKYLGKTTKPDCHKYRGSGKRWLNHIKYHGYEVTTEILKECETKDEIKYWGRHYSDLWNVVESLDYANLKPEDGDGGSHSEYTKQKLREANLGKKHSPETIAKKKLYVVSENTKKLISAFHKGRPKSAATKKKMSLASRGKPKQYDVWNKGLKGKFKASVETKKNISKSLLEYNKRKLGLPSDLDILQEVLNTSITFVSQKYKISRTTIRRRIHQFDEYTLRNAHKKDNHYAKSDNSNGPG